MNPFPTLRSWLGRPSHATRKKTPPARPDSALSCERLEDRLTPDKTFASLPGPDAPPPPATGTELVASIQSATPLSDLANVVAFLNLTNLVDLTRSSVAFAGDTSAVLSVALRSPTATGQVMQSLLSSGIFDFVTPNFVYAPAAGTGPDLRERLPNDPLFPSQLHHPIIQTPSAWDRTFGDPAVVVAVIDDGVDTSHPDLKDNIWANAREVAGDGIDNDGNGFIDDGNGWDFVGNRNVVTPDTAADTHGTQVAGLIAGRIDNGLGIAGVAGRSAVMPLKVVGNGPTTSLALARAVGYAVQNGARIINNSLNIDSFVNDPVFKAAVTFAYSRGLLWVNSAGNLNLANPLRQKFDEILFVAATDRNDVKTPYSNYGTGIDLSAPGGLPDDGLITTFVGGGYGPAYGTSMAAALVSGTAALIWSAFPNHTRDQVASALMGTADSLDPKNPAFLDMLGAGRLNAGAASAGAPFVTRLGRLKGLPEPGQPAPAHLPGFTLRLVSPLEPSTVVPSNFELRWAGPDNRFNTPDDALLPLSAKGVSDYRTFTNQFDFTVGSELSRGLYRFTARSGGLADPFSRPVDGDGNNQPGGDLVRIFGIEFQVRGTTFEDVDNDGSSADTEPPSPGQAVFADRNDNGILDRVTFSSNSPALAIPDANPNGVAATFPIFGVTDPLCDLVVSVTVSHPCLSDLTITLVGPNGERVVLFRNRQLIRFNTNAATLIFQDDIQEEAKQNPREPAIYRLRPEERLDTLRDIVANGIWQIEVRDTTAEDTGGLLFSSINAATEPCATTDSLGRFALAGLPPGVSQLYVTPRPGWIQSAGGKGVAIGIAPSGDVPEVTFGLLRQGAIYGRVLRDGGDGVFGPGDAGQPGMTVFVDRNGNAVPDTGDVVAVTDPGGNFVLTGLAAGKHTVRLADRPGFDRLTPGVQTALVSSLFPVSTGNDFLVRKETAPVRVTVAPISPPVRVTPVDSLAITLSEPVPDFDLTDLILTRDNQVVPLTGATLIGSGQSYTLIGLAALTLADGAYQLTARVPAPPGEPGRQPVPVQVAWTTDATAPTGVMTPIHGSGVTAVRVVFSEDVFGVTPAAFVLRRDGFDVSLDGAEVVGSGADYQLINLAPLTQLPGEYTLEVIPAGVTDAAGNRINGGVATTFTVDDGPTNPPREGQRTVVGIGPGGAPLVNVYDTVSGKLLFTVVAFETTFSGGVRVAAGDVTGDGVEDLIVAPGPGGGPRIRLFDGRDGRELATLMAFEEGFTGGLYVAAGDMTGDGVADIVVTPDTGGGPRVRVFSGQSLAPVADFFGIEDPAFRGGARAAVGDLNGDGTRDLLVSAGFGGGPRIAGYEGQSVAANAPVRLFNDFFIFEETLRNGAFLAAGDVNGDGFADVIAGGGPTGGPRVFALSGQALVETGLFSPLANFFAGDPEGRGGVRVAVKDLDGDAMADLLAADGFGQGAIVRAYSGNSLVDNPDPPFTEFDAFNGFAGGVYVG